MRINILYQFTDNPWGGGNQFLKAIKKFVKKETFIQTKLAMQM